MNGHNSEEKKKKYELEQQHVLDQYKMDTALLQIPQDDTGKNPSILKIC
jgi:hypothetical protein